MVTKKSAASKPTHVTLHNYNVGFGDCYLLSFHYASGDRHILIDFGSTKLPEDNNDPKLMTKIAAQIQKDCGNKLTAVVATHRHKDHISGFTPAKAKNGPGDIIRSLAPELVVQPWTEDPALASNATGPLLRLVTESRKLSAHEHNQLRVMSLANMNRYADYAFELGKSLLRDGHKDLAAQLMFLGDDNGLPNREAVLNLRSMGKENRYVYHGSESGLGALLPGVKVSVLGPPTLQQTDTIAKQRTSDSEQFWATNRTRTDFWARRAAVAARDGAAERPLFPRHVEDVPQDARWYAYYARRELAESQLAIVRSLDDQMNNTSVILLFEVGKKMLLFPGDAQYENWMFALSKPEIVRRLQKVDLYKVGHHGSRNATPKSLWEGFGKRGGKGAANRLSCHLSTRSHVHGHEKNNAEVPRRTLVDTMTRESDIFDTRTVKKGEYSLTQTIEI